MAKRGAAIIEARGASSAASAASAAIDHVYDWVHGTAQDDWTSVGLVSDGSYRIPEGLVAGFPARSVNGSWQIVQGLELDEFSRARIDASIAEVVGERDAVSELGLIWKSEFSLRRKPSGDRRLSAVTPVSAASSRKIKGELTHPTQHSATNQVVQPAHDETGGGLSRSILRTSAPYPTLPACRRFAFDTRERVSRMPDSTRRNFLIATGAGAAAIGVASALPGSRREPAGSGKQANCRPTPSRSSPISVTRAAAACRCWSANAR